MRICYFDRVKIILAYLAFSNGLYTYTNKHTHTHKYIYIYVYIYITKCQQSPENSNLLGYPLAESEIRTEV